MCHTHAPARSLIPHAAATLPSSHVRSSEAETSTRALMQGVIQHPRQYTKASTKKACEISTRLNNTAGHIQHSIFLPFLPFVLKAESMFRKALAPI